MRLICLDCYSGHVEIEIIKSEGTMNKNAKGTCDSCHKEWTVAELINDR